MATQFKVNGAKGRTADTKPKFYYGDTFVQTNITSGSYVLENMGRGNKTTINLKSGGNIIYKTYENTAGKMSVPMSGDMYTIGWVVQQADMNDGVKASKLVDEYLGVAAVINNSTFDYPENVTIGQEFSINIQGDPIEFILLK